MELFLLLHTDTERKKKKVDEFGQLQFTLCDLHLFGIFGM